jgi:membrane-bound lytic murein transglycosylase B
MPSADPDDNRPTTDLSTPTVRIGDRYEEEALEPQVRGGRFWLPLVIFVVLLSAVALLGVIGFPNHSAQLAVPTRSTTTATSTAPPGPTAAPPPSLPNLPTPPPRPADALADWATKVNMVTDIPVVAAEAYGYAQLLAQNATPACHLGWTTLAAIGSVESNHGQANGSVLLPSGRSDPPINGPSLDGKDGRALVADTDGGAYDGDPNFDRAMGPMQLLPSMWVQYRIDADGDGILDPYDIDDASAAMARLLCASGQDLATKTGFAAALATYHPGDTYESVVFADADSYGQRTSRIG